MPSLPACVLNAAHIWSNTLVSDDAANTVTAFGSATGAGVGLAIASVVVRGADGGAAAVGLGRATGASIPPQPAAAMGGLLGLRSVAGATLSSLLNAGLGAVTVLFLLVLFRMVLRRAWAAVAAFLVVDDKGNATLKPFLDGFLEDNKGDPPMWGRPVDVLVMRDGALLMSDDYNGVIYRISYKK